MKTLIVKKLFELHLPKFFNMMTVKENLPVTVDSEYVPGGIIFYWAGSNNRIASIEKQNGRTVLFIEGTASVWKIFKKYVEDFISFEDQLKIEKELTK